MNVSEAIQALDDAVRASLEAAKIQGARAFETGEFELAKRAADEGKTMEAFLEEVTRIKRRWENLQPVAHEPGASPELPAPPGGNQQTSTPVNPEGLVQPILRVLEDMGGTAQRDDVIERLEQVLLEESRSPNEGSSKASLPDGWVEMLAAAQKDMVKRGLLHARPQRGIWQITPQGRLLLFERQ
jgi:hypothetical protein